MKKLLHIEIHEHEGQWYALSVFSVGASERVYERISKGSYAFVKGEAQRAAKAVPTKLYDKSN